MTSRARKIYLPLTITRCYSSSVALAANDTTTKEDEMRKEFIECDTMAEAGVIAPWAAVIVSVDSGFMAFESIADYRVFKGQK